MIYQLKQSTIDIYGENALEKFMEAGWTKEQLVYWELAEEMPEAEGMKSADMQALQDEYDAFKANNFNGCKITNVEDPEPATEAIPKDFSEIDAMIEKLGDLIGSYVEKIMDNKCLQEAMNETKPKPIFDVYGVQIKRGDYIISTNGLIAGFVKECDISGALYLNSCTQDIRALQCMGKLDFRIHREYCPTPEIINTLMYDIKGHEICEGDYVGATDGNDTIEGVVYKKDGVLWLEDIKLEYLFNLNSHISVCRAHQGK